ncbi:hypothetical protein B296_00041743 [Ensete ventricosum]|uniref:Uncharacterized protein n=1 Tax=Ensete ventricosum TaxID=4639 RepID=A0A426YL62_ENSVE|nr:hypothetical protein B296_00041743 [Ensete ventricosum]
MASRPRHWHWITHKPRGLRLALFFRGFVPGLLFGNLVPVKLLKAVAPAVEVEKSSLLKLDPPTVSKKILWWILLVEAIGDDEEETFLDNGSESERRHRADTGRRMFLKAPPKAISISRNEMSRSCRDLKRRDRDQGEGSPRTAHVPRRSLQLTHHATSVG